MIAVADLGGIQGCKGTPLFARMLKINYCSRQSKIIFMPRYTIINIVRTQDLLVFTVRFTKASQVWQNCLLEVAALTASSERAYGNLQAVGHSLLAALRTYYVRLHANHVMTSHPVSIGVLS